MMQRRTILKCLSGGLAFLSASLVAIPGVGFLVEHVRRRPSNKSLIQRVTKVKDLQPEKPRLIPVVGTRRDAWTNYPSETIGRVWVVLHGDPADAKNASVDAFTSICPHLGCQVQLDGKQDRFVCPCHKAEFDKSGTPVSERQLGHRNHAPRGLDSLECELVQDEATGEWWVEVKYETFEQGLTRKVVQS